MTKHDLQLFVEQLLNGQPVAVFKFIGLFIAVFVLCFMLLRIVRSKKFKVAIILILVAFGIGFIIAPEAMSAKFTEWAEQLWGDDGAQDYSEFYD